MWEPCRLQATEVSHWYSFLRTATHLLLKASCTLELVTDLFWFLHTNLTMGKAAGIAELSLMFGTFQFVYCQPSTLGFPSNWLALLFANEKVIKKTHNYLSMYLSLTCMYQLLRWPCLKKEYKICCSFPHSDMVTALGCSSPAATSTTSCMRFPSNGKVPATKAFGYSFTQLAHRKAII